MSSSNQSQATVADEERAVNPPQLMVDDIVFNGENGIDCKTFIRMVQTRAFAASNSWDDKWIAELAERCFSGVALEWYLSLSKEIQKDWIQLRAALLAKYPLKDGEGLNKSPSTGVLPSPRSPSFAATPGFLSPVADVMPVGVAGVVQVESEYPRPSYISRCSGMFSPCGRTCDIAEALVVQVAPARNGALLLEIQNCQCTDEKCSFLLLSHKSSAVFERVNEETGHRYQMQMTNCWSIRGVPDDYVLRIGLDAMSWRIQGDGTLRPSSFLHGVSDREPLYPIIGKNVPRMSFVKDPNTLMNDGLYPPYQQARLIFRQMDPLAQV